MNFDYQTPRLERKKRSPLQIRSLVPSFLDDIIKLMEQLIHATESDVLPHFPMTSEQLIHAMTQLIYFIHFSKRFFLLNLVL